MVVLPGRDGPTRTKCSPLEMSSVTPRTPDLLAGVDFGEIADGDGRHAGIVVRRQRGKNSTLVTPFVLSGAFQISEDIVYDRAVWRYIPQDENAGHRLPRSDSCIGESDHRATVMGDQNTAFDGCPRQDFGIVGRLRNPDVLDANQVNFGLSQIQAVKDRTFNVGVTDEP